MTAVLLSVHVLAAVLTVGPVSVAASMFPPAVRTLTGTSTTAATAVTLHRICRTYATVGIAVPGFGVATAAALGVLGDAWVLVSLVLTAAAAALLVAAILPLQRRLLAAGSAGAAEGSPRAARLAALTGIFNLLWAAVVVIMIVRPGSTTGAS